MEIYSVVHSRTFFHSLVREQNLKFSCFLWVHFSCLFRRSQGRTNVREWRPTNSSPDSIPRGVATQTEPRADGHSIHDDFTWLLCAILMAFASFIRKVNRSGDWLLWWLQKNSLHIRWSQTARWAMNLSLHGAWADCRLSYYAIWWGSAWWNHTTISIHGEATGGNLWWLRVWLGRNGYEHTSWILHVRSVSAWHVSWLHP